MDKRGQEGRDERSKLKICTEKADAWTKVVKKGRDEWTKLKNCPEDPDA